ncbi:MAG: Na/Pi cotransporter family protein, partial [Ruminiclostridium sp.]|nr:Na/Pi cotransporter family protein [Ruminiclostridium sp.]
MDIFDVLTMIGGLCLFLFGMHQMGAYLEKFAGGSLKMLLGKMTSNKILGFLTGMLVTAVIQSSSATTVMVVGFVNSGLLSLRQAIGVIMGANVGTTVTSWILSLAGIDGGSIFMKMLKPTSFTPILALVGTILIMMAKSEKKKDIGMILLGFSVLMFGMDIMSDAVSGLKDVPEFQQLFVMFQNPILGVLAGAALTAIIQSSSASVGILQALSVTGSITYGAAIPIIMGQNIGTTVTAMLSSVGTNRNARRAAVVHLLFNVVGSTVLLVVFMGANAVLNFAFVDLPIDHSGIAIVHTAFNILCTVLLLPCAGLLEKLAYKVLPEEQTPDQITILDQRLLHTPAVAIARAQEVAETMARISMDALKTAIYAVKEYDTKVAGAVRETEH